MYVVHLMGAVPMLVLEVPFGKWAHLAYRPLAMYFASPRSTRPRSCTRKPDRPDGGPRGPPEEARWSPEDRRLHLQLRHQHRQAWSTATRRRAAAEPDVVVAKSYKYMCSNPGQEMIVSTTSGSRA
jgi:hypothetical protein